MVYRKQWQGSYGRVVRPERVDRAWWTKDGEELGQSVSDNLVVLKDQDRDREARHTALLSVYKNRHIARGRRYGAAHSLFGTGSLVGTAKVNLARTRVDAIHNRISKHRPMANFVPTSANYTIRRKCKGLTRYVQSEMDNLGMKALGPKAALDGCIVGLGVLKPYRVGSDIKICRPSATDIFVDELEAAYDNITQLFERAVISRSVALFKFVDEPLRKELISRYEAGKRRNAILEAMPMYEEFSRSTMISDPIEMCEAWKLPSGKGAKDGKHAVAIGSCVIDSKEYTYSDFPHTFFSWSPDPVSFWPTSLVEELLGCHITANHLRERIIECVDLNASPYIFVDRAANVSEADITDVAGTWIEYTRQKPHVESLNLIPPELLQLEQQNNFEADRIARIHNGGQMPGSLQTGEAVREWNDADAESFSIVLQEYENMHMDVALKIVRLAKEAYEEDPSFTIVAKKDRYTVSRIPWEEVDMEEDEFTISVQPTSSLPRSVPKRIEKAIELYNVGAYETKAEFLQALDMVDFNGPLDMMTAEIDAIDAMLERIIDKGIPQQVEPMMTPKLVITRAKARYFRAIEDGVPERHLNLIRLVVVQATEKMQQQAAMLAANQAGIVDPSGPPPLDGSGQNPLSMQQEILQ